MFLLSPVIDMSVPNRRSQAAIHLVMDHDPSRSLAEGICNDHRGPIIFLIFNT